jgi:hypothetical protein
MGFVSEREVIANDGCFKVNWVATAESQASLADLIRRKGASTQPVYWKLFWSRKVELVGLNNVPYESVAPRRNGTSRRSGRQRWISQLLETDRT